MIWLLSFFSFWTNMYSKKSMKSVSFWTELSSIVHLFSKTVPELILIIIISCIVISVDIINNWFTLCSSRAASKLTQTNTMYQAYCWCPRNSYWIEAYWGNAWRFPRFQHNSLFCLYRSFISWIKSIPKHCFWLHYEWDIFVSPSDVLLLVYKNLFLCIDFISCNFIESVYSSHYFGWVMRIFCYIICK